MDKKAIFINTASQVIVRFVTLAFTLISIKLLTNYLGPAGIGNYNTITTYINFFIVIADLGLFASTVREISKDSDREKKIISNVFTLRLITALLASILAIIIVALTNYSQDIKLGVAICTLFLFFNLLSSVYDMALQYRLKMQYSALSEFLSKLLTLIALYVLIKHSANFIWIIGTVGLSGILIFLFKFLFSSSLINIKPSYDRKLFNWIFSVSWPLGVVFIVNNLFFKLDTLMLFVIKGSVAVGIYSVAYKVLEVTVFVPAYFASSLKPTISQYIANNKNQLAQVISKSIMVLVISVMPLMAIFIGFSKEIIVFLSNTEFASGANALILLAFTLPLIFIDTLISEILIANDERKLLIRISVFILLFNFIANLVFIPIYSFMGAAYTTFFSEILLLGIHIYYTRKIVPYSVDLGMLFKNIVVFLLVLIFSFLIKNIGLHFMVLIGISAAFYTLMFVLFRVANLSSIKEMLTR